jgi:PAS domain S-box-containing protein
MLTTTENEINLSPGQIINSELQSAEPQSEALSTWPSAAFMEALVQSANDAIISKDMDGLITSWNRGAERLFGYKAAEAIGQPVSMLIPTDRQAQDRETLEKVKTGVPIEHYETVRRRKDGTLIDISLTVSPIRNSHGIIVGASKVAREISDLRRAQAQLHESEERYRTLFNSIDEGFCLIQMQFDAQGTPVDYLFLETNPTFERQTGLVDATGQSMRSMAPDHEQSWFDIYGAVALTGEPIRFENYSEVLDRWFDLYAFRVGEPGDHKVAVIFNNVTHRKRAEREGKELLQQLEAERSKLAYLFEKAPAFVVTLSGQDHVVELTNPAYLQLIGHRDVVGKPIRQALPEVEGQGFFELLDRVYQSGEAFDGREINIQLQRQPGGPLESRIMNFVYQPIFGADGAVSGIFAHGIDITEQVQARRDAEIANRTKDEFLATLSHELRTPLNAIIGWASLMSDDGLTDKEKERGLETILRNARLQSQLIEDILDVSRIITGKLRLEVRSLELSSVIEAAVESVLPSAQAKNIRLQRVLDSGTSLISGDPNRLQQVVWNLLTNAIKFTPKGGRVQIRLERVNSHVEIVVTDTGLGISPEVLPHVFERFSQADSTSTRNYGGLGLGLAIVRHIIDMHGGSVEAESPGEGQGAIFTVKLPLMAARAVDTSPQSSEERVHPSSSNFAKMECPPELEGLHVLIVDDEDDARGLVKTILESCRARVTTARNAAEALELVQTARPDVLISDLGMPGEDGYSLIGKLRALPPERGGKTPAAALTAYARVEDRLKVLRAGFQIHLPKPIEPAELVAVVANLAQRIE